MYDLKNCDRVKIISENNKINKSFVFWFQGHSILEVMVRQKMKLYLLMDNLVWIIPFKDILLGILSILGIIWCNIQQLLPQLVNYLILYSFVIIIIIIKSTIVLH